MATHIAFVHGEKDEGVLRRPFRRTAIVVGVLLIVCSVANVLFSTSWWSST